MVSHDYGIVDVTHEITNALTTIGNGNVDNGKALLVALAERLIHAREKHPEFARSDVGAWTVINDEMAELWHAVCYESPERVQDELLDVLATAARFYNGEDTPSPMHNI